jgi:threonine/homoserine/homoserine lactone efflux protein
MNDVLRNILRNILLGITLAIPIGPASLAVIQTGLRAGFLRAWLTGIGVTLADTTYLLVVYFGLSAFMGIPAVKVIVWILGALVLFYLGWQSLRGLWASSRKRDFLSVSQDGEVLPDRGTGRNPLLVGYLVNISNPIAVVFWAGIYGSLIGAAVAAGGDKSDALISGAAILLGILSWHTTTSFLSHWGRRLLNEKIARIISAIAGVVLILFGLRFAWNAITALLG